MQSRISIIYIQNRNLVLDSEWAVSQPLKLAGDMGLKANSPEVKQDNIAGMYGYKSEKVACLFQYCYMNTILLLPEDMTICTHFCKPTLFNGLAWVGLFEVLEMALLLIH